jgi:hypothetical protein
MRKEEDLREGTARRCRETPSRNTQGGVSCCRKRKREARTGRGTEKRGGAERGGSEARVCDKEGD